MDHTEYLGNRISDIAKEKFAVMRAGVQAIFAGGEAEVEDLFFAHSKISKTPAQVLRRLCSYGLNGTSLNGTDFYIETECLHSDYHTPLIGTFQADNSVLAVMAAYVLKYLNKGAFDKIDNSSIHIGVANTRWPGRFELINEDPVLICDGAHNPHGITRLVETIRSIAEGKQVCIVLAMMKDKDIMSALKIFKTLDATVRCTQVPDMERCMPASELFLNANKAGLRTTDMYYDDPVNAINISMSEKSFTVCCGSLYLAGYVKGNSHEIRRI